VTYNSFGDSDDSSLSNPTVLVTYPDAPISLIEITAGRSFNQIMLSWQDGDSGNGSPFVDYVVSMAIGAESDSFTVIAD